MSAWEQKAHSIIKTLCEESYKMVNSKPTRKLRPYTVPSMAMELVNVLGWHDRIAAEYRAKQIFAAYHVGLAKDWHLYQSGLAV